jgi:putative acetyltransferase
MHIRLAQVSDAPILMRLFYNTVHSVNCQDYNLEQLNAWAPALTNPNHWQPQFLSQWTFVVEADVVEADSKVIGFCELEQDGHIGCFYCHYQHQRQGVGSLLMQHLEAIALQQSMILYTEASIMAKPFFEHWGFQVVQVQDVERYGVLLRNFVMSKRIKTP